MRVKVGARPARGQADDKTQPILANGERKNHVPRVQANDSMAFHLTNGEKQRQSEKQNHTRAVRAGQRTR